MKRPAIARRLAVLCCFLLLTSLLPGLAFAGEQEIPTTIEPGSGLASTAEMQNLIQDLGLDKESDRVELSLDQLISLALNRNLSLVIQRYERKRSLLNLDAEYGIYDFNLEGTFSLGEDTRPPSSALEAADLIISEDARLNLTLNRLLRTGGTAQIDFTNNVSESTDAFFSFNPRITVNLDLTVSQPLLRNFGKTVTERNIVVAKTDAEVNRADFQSQVESVIEEAVTGYWDLVEARAQLDVARESLDLAKELDEMNRVQVDVGTMAPLELVQSEAGVAARQEDIIRFEALKRDSEDTLRRLINLDRSFSWDTEIVPTTEAEVEHQEIDVAGAVEKAFEARPELQRLRLQNETRRLDAKIAANQIKPRLDAQATWGYNAIDGESFVTDPQTGEQVLVDNGYLDAIDQITGLDYKGWSVALQFAMPLQNRDAKARAAIADMAVEQGDLELRNLEEQIFTEVRRAVRNVETAAQQIATAKVSSKLARKNLEAEQKRYENGLSTSFQVLQIQEDLSEALSREVSAVISYRRSEVIYQRTISQVLAAYGVRLADD